MPNDQPNRPRSQSNGRSVRNLALERLSAPSAQSIVGRVIMLSLFAIALMGVATAIMLSRSDSNQGEDFNPSVVAQYNFAPVKSATDQEPGRIILNMPKEEGGAAVSFDPPDLPASISIAAQEPSTPDQPVAPFSQRIVEAIAEEGGVLSARLQAEAALVDDHPHPPAFTLPVRIEQDLWNTVTPSLSINEHLSREWHLAERQPIPSGSKESGPYYEPLMMETPRIALDSLLADVAKATPDAIAGADNGHKFINFVQPRVVEAVRGTVFTVEGRLWMLRQQPLRHPVTMDGETVSTAYWGIVAYLRPGLSGVEPRSVVHDLACFTALRLPPELAKHALEPGVHPSSSDSLAKEMVGVRLRGVWFRRIAWRESVAELKVELPQSEDVKERPRDEVRQFVSEAFMPYLISRGAEIVPFRLPDVAETRRLVLMYSEDDTPVSTSQRDKFDEAGYYALLGHLAAGSGPLLEMPVQDLTLRELITPTSPLRNQYRGAHSRVKGILMDTYHPLVLPPNISGVRQLYRTFIADATNRSEVSQELIWFADVLEPPLRFRGAPPVELEGFYVRSQLLRTNIGGRTVLVNQPLLLAREIKSPEGAIGAADLGGQVETATVVSIIGAVALLVLAVVLLWRREKRREEKWQREMLAGLARKAPANKQKNASEADRTE